MPQLAQRTVHIFSNAQIFIVRVCLPYTSRVRQRGAAW